ncbi:hypothetical protein ACSSS7_000404 [Eimeria intestinalis]
MSVSDGQHPHTATSPPGSASLDQGPPADVFDCGTSDGFWQRTPNLRQPARGSRPRRPPEASKWEATQSPVLFSASKGRGAPLPRPPDCRRISRAEQPLSQLRQLQQLARGASLKKSLSSLLIEEAFSRTSSNSSRADSLLTAGGSAPALAEKKAVRLPVLALANPTRHIAAPEAAGGGAPGPTLLWSTWGALQKPNSDELSSRRSLEQSEALRKDVSMSQDSSASSSSREQKQSQLTTSGGPPESGDPRGWGHGDSAQDDRRASTRGPSSLPPSRVPPWQRPLIGSGNQHPAAASSLQEATGGSPFGPPQNGAIVARGTGMLSRRCSAGDLQGLRSGRPQATGGIRREASWPHPPPHQRGLLQPPPAAAAVAEAAVRRPYGALRSFSQGGQAQPCWNLVTTQSISSAATRAAREAAAAAAAAAADAAAAVARRTHSPEAKAIAESAAAAAAGGLAPPEAAAEHCPFSKQRGDPQLAVLIKQIVAAPAAAPKRPAPSSRSANAASIASGVKALPPPVSHSEAAVAAAAAADGKGFDSAPKIVGMFKNQEPGVTREPAEDSEAAAAGAAQADRPEVTAAAEAADGVTPEAAPTAKAAIGEAANGAEAAGAAEAAIPEGSLPPHANRSGPSGTPGSGSQPCCSEGPPSIAPPQEGCRTARRKIEEVLRQPLFRPPRKPWKLFDVQRPLRLKVVTLGPSGSGKSCLVRRFCERRFVGSPFLAGGGEGPPVGGERRPSHTEGGRSSGGDRTIALDFGVRDVMLETGEKVRLHFIDLSGAPEFSDVGWGGPLKGADVVLGVFSAREPEALQPTLSRLLEAKQQTGRASFETLSLSFVPLTPFCSSLSIAAAANPASELSTCKDLMLLPLRSGALLALVAAKASRSTAATVEAAAAAAADAGVLFYAACAETAEGVDDLFLETAAKAAANIRSRCSLLAAS